mgnify:CR=1 FL=1
MGKGKLGLAALLLASTSLQAAVPTVSELRSYIMTPTPLTAEQFTDFDRNADSQIDVADLVYLLAQDKVIDVAFKTGSYVGIFQSDTIVASGSNGTNEMLPLEIQLDSLSPVSGKLDNSEDNFSLYFPSGSHVLEDLTINDLHIEFTVNVSSSVPMISSNTITRTLVFSGDLSAVDNAVAIAGTYEEKISGFEDVQGQGLEVNRSGNFVLFQE